MVEEHSALQRPSPIYKTRPLSQDIAIEERMTSEAIIGRVWRAQAGFYDAASSLPIWYCTKTILSPQTLRLDKLLHQSRPSASVRRCFSQRCALRRDFRPYRKQAAGSDDENIPFETSPPHVNQQRHKATPQRNQSVLPFEGLRRRSSKEATEGKTTLTSAEATTFKKLLLLDRKELKPVADPATPERSTLTAVEEAIGANFMQPEEALALKWAARFESSSNAVPEIESELDRKATGICRRVTSLMQDAQTDERMWTILHDEVVAPVLALGLDSEVADAPSNTSSQPTDNQTKAADKPLDANSLEVLTRTFPKLLVSFQEIMRKAFPSSLYRLAVLPSLQQHGPAAFALGSSTDLFNHHLDAQYQQMSDLEGMIRTLQMMHENVFDFNSRTFGIVDSVLQSAHRAKQGTASRGLYWEAGYARDRLYRLHGWRDKIQENINEQALVEASKREAAFASVDRAVLGST